MKRRDKREMEKRERREREKWRRGKRRKTFKESGINYRPMVEQNGQCKKGCKSAYTHKKNNIERNGEEREKKEREKKN